MTSTLVLGGTRSEKSRHAESLLRQHDRVTLVATGSGPLESDATVITPRSLRDRAPRPESWQVVQTRNLTRALLGSRHPVLVDGIVDWLRGQLDDNDLWDDPQAATDHLEDLLDELTVAVRAVPFDTVVLTEDPGWSLGPGDPGDRLAVELLGHTNERLSAACHRVHTISAGRVVDLSDAPLLAR